MYMCIFLAAFQDISRTDSLPTTSPTEGATTTCRFHMNLARYSTTLLNTGQVRSDAHWLAGGL